MNIQYGARVVDKNGRVMGKVDFLARDTWTGGIRKFLVRQKAPEEDLFLSPGDVLETTDQEITLKVGWAELKGKTGS
jgi:sporulation protein YlmC with PRC-barrel domain